MDRYELKVTIGEIDTLVRKRKFAQAAEIADTVDWRKVKNVRVLCTVSDIYKINRRYEDSKRVLEMAYARNPRGRQIIFSLCELELKLNNYIRALQLYNNFVNVAPRDPDRFVLQYKLYKAQDVNVNERIAVLEELNKEDYREKWSYELARLYKEAGERALCIAQCDEMIAFFRSGRYVLKALELKASMTELTPEQKERYMQLTGGPSQETAEPAQVSAVSEEPAQTQDAQHEDPPQGDAGAGNAAGSVISEQTEPEADLQSAQTRRIDSVEPNKEQSKVMQAEEAARIPEELPALNRAPIPEEIPWEYDEPGADRKNASGRPADSGNEAAQKTAQEGQTGAPIHGEKKEEQSYFDDSSFRVDPLEESPFSEESMRRTIMKGLRDLDSYDTYLTQESDGQYAMVMEDEKRADSQIAGQLNLQEIMSEWEKVKRDFYESNAAENGRAKKGRDGGAGKTERVLTKSWDPAEVHDALKIRDDDEEGTGYDTSLFVTEDGGAFPAEFAVEDKSGEPSGGVRVITDRTYMHSEDSIRQLSNALNRILLDGSTGNVIITGDEGAGTLSLAREMIRRYRRQNPNFVGQIAKSEGRYVTRENMLRVIPRIPFGALIVERAANMSEEGAAALCEMLSAKDRSVLIILIDRKGVMDAFLSDHPKIREMFPARVDIAALGIDTLLGYAREYAGKQQCEIDEYGISALESRVRSMQTVEHSVTLEDIRDIVDEAIYYASRKTISNLVDTFSRRRGGGTKLLLRDRDFLHY